VFSASKVWTMGADNGRQQIEMSRARWGVAHFDLVQVHNMMDWRAHLPTLQSMQRQEQLRYIGITTSHGRRHDAIATALRQERIDTVQLTYNIAERSAEDTLLPLAQDRGVAVIVNRPFATGALFRRVAGVSLPGWAREIECQDWAAVFLKFIISHPAVTVAIPATSQVAHLRQNMRALNGPLPDAALRRRMASDFDRVAR
ncbi:MAG: aldo/keto reductase, partial [Pseudomonadota bacterium]